MFETLADILVNEIVCRYGVPTSVLSDQGTNFGSKVIQDLCDSLGIQRVRTTAYHPQGNGQVERFNRTAEAMIAKVIDGNQRNWDKCLPKMLFAYRSAIHDSTKFTPFTLTFGRTPTLPVDVMLGCELSEVTHSSCSHSVTELRKTMSSMFVQARAMLKQSQQHQKQNYDSAASDRVVYNIGNRVWLYVPVVQPGTTLPSGEVHIL